MLPEVNLWRHGLSFLAIDIQVQTRA